MERIKRLGAKELGLAAVFVMAAATFCLAGPVEEKAADGGAKSKDKIEQRRAEWQKLKQEDPQKFQEEMAKKRRAMKQKLEDLKKTDPQKYEKVVGKIKERRQGRLEELKKQDPEKYKTMLLERRERFRARLEELKKTDPEKYKAIAARQAERQRLRELRKNDPEAYKQYIEEHPELKGNREHLARERLGNHAAASSEGAGPAPEKR